MKCSNCKKNYKDNLAMCPKCGEANSKLLEDKTMAIMEVNEDLSLTAMISNQIDEFNEDNNEEIVKEAVKLSLSTEEFISRTGLIMILNNFIK